GVGGSGVGRGGVTDPATAGRYIDSLGDREFGARVLHIPTECGRIGRGGSGIHDSPTVVLQRPPILLVGRMDVQRDLKLLPGQLGKFDKFSELVNLQAERYAAKRDRSVGAPPTGDRREARRVAFW